MAEVVQPRKGAVRLAENYFGKRGQSALLRRP
jgi:hypothetical protein